MKIIFHIGFILLSILLFFNMTIILKILNIDSLYYYSPYGGESPLDAQFFLWQMFYSLLLFSIYGIVKPINCKSAMIILLLSLVLTFILNHSIWERDGANFLKHFFCISIFWIEFTIILIYFTSNTIIKMIKRRIKK